MIHRLAHLFGLNRGTVETFYWGAFMVSCFECRACGELEHFFISQRP